VPFLILGFTLLVILLAIALTPLSLIQRYRLGTSRRRARGWLLALNVGGLLLSILMFLAGAALTSIWVPHAFVYSMTGLAAGGLLGVFGLVFTRFEAAPGSLHYTPNRWLVLAITLAVSARVLFGLWRSWAAWRAAPDTAAWAAASGAAQSLGVGAVVLGYYFVYWLGVRRRLRRVV
jgi:hypothetical protein